MLLGISNILRNLSLKGLRQTLQKYPKTAQVQNISRSAVRFVTAMDDKSDDQEKPKEQAETIVPSKNGTRYKRRHMKRQWDELRKDEGETADKKLCDEKGDRIKRKKMAVLLGYCGVDYYGMQRNPGVRTIEEDLMKALLEAKYITEDDFKNQQNTHFQRSSRTDKGVSAARQVVSLKLPLEASADEINKRLPDCIKVFSIKRVTNKFNSKSKCNARTYSYTLPTYVFEPSLESEQERKQYRITPEKLEKIANVLNVYKGTKSYHNFTEKKHYQDPSASRYMMDFAVDKVFVESEMEFAVLSVKGQSFMLHQIRKMVGLTIAIVRGHTDMTILDKVFGKDKVMIPTAPGLGLVLDKVHYDRYDNKFKDTHDSLTWDAEEEDVLKFTQEHIYPNIVRGEIEQNSIGLWLEKLKQHSYDPADNTTEQEDDQDISLVYEDDDEINQNDDLDEEKANKVKNSEEKQNSEVDNSKIVQDSEVGQNLDVGNSKMVQDSELGQNSEVGNSKMVQDSEVGQNLDVGNSKMVQDSELGQNSEVGNSKMVQNSELGQNSEVENSKIEQNSELEQNSDVANSKIEQNSDIEPISEIENSIKKQNSEEQNSEGKISTENLTSKLEIHSEEKITTSDVEKSKENNSNVSADLKSDLSKE